jgi:hypothetical protein
MALRPAFKSLLLSVSLTLVAGSSASAQSGGASLRGWVAFQDVAYETPQPRAKVELIHDAPESNIAYVTETDEHGFFAFPHTSLGRFTLRITAAKFQPYSAEVYIPSDFAGNWAVQLRTLKVSSKSR